MRSSKQTSGERIVKDIKRWMTSDQEFDPLIDHFDDHSRNIMKLDCGLHIEWNITYFDKESVIATKGTGNPIWTLPRSEQPTDPANTYRRLRISIVDELNPGPWMQG